MNSLQLLLVMMMRTMHLLFHIYHSGSHLLRVNLTHSLGLDWIIYLDNFIKQIFNLKLKLANFNKVQFVFLSVKVFIFYVIFLQSVCIHNLLICLN